MDGWGYVESLLPFAIYYFDYMLCAKFYAWTLKEWGLKTKICKRFDFIIQPCSFSHILLNTESIGSNPKWYQIKSPLVASVYIAIWYINYTRLTLACIEWQNSKTFPGPDTIFKPDQTNYQNYLISIQSKLEISAELCSIPELLDHGDPDRWTSYSGE